MSEIIAIAKRAPSSMNTQPWNFHVITGEPLEMIRKGNTERMLAGASVDREIKMSAHGYQGVHRERQIEIAIQLFEAMGIERDDKERRQDWVMRGFRQFDAPVSVVITIDKELADDTVAHFDCGAATYGLVLAATSKGLGCVINGQGIMQSTVVREHGNIPEDEIIMTCVAMGWPNEEFVATMSSRGALPTTMWPALLASTSETCHRDQRLSNTGTLRGPRIWPLAHVVSLDTSSA